jgi:phosphate transport system ATP-binding protein
MSNPAIRIGDLTPAHLVRGPRSAASTVKDVAATIAQGTPIHKETLEVKNLTAYYGATPAISGVDLSFGINEITALIGPSGCGKSTLLRCLNGMHLTIPGSRVEGNVLFGGIDIYGSNVDIVEVRHHIGMVFQRANPFPTMSIHDNVIAGIRLGGRSRRRPKSEYAEIVERSLTQAGLWREVKERLDQPGGGLSGGQQQRLCIARALAVQPSILLMDEPCSALDPISTLAIEDTITQLKEELTIVIVTHNMQQAARVSDRTAFMTLEAAGEPGQLIEVGTTKEIFNTPSKKSTDDYIRGRFG